MTEQVKRYVEMKQKLGYNFATQALMLHSFARFAQSRGETIVKSATVLCWATASEAASQPQRARKLRVVRAFACWMNAGTTGHEIPPQGVLGSSTVVRKPPQLISVGNIQKLMDAALDLRLPGSIAPLTWHHLIGLIATTGMRISEALALTFNDITSDGLVIRNSKFGKSRMIALHPSAWEALNSYLKVRYRQPTGDDHLFVIATGRPPGSRYAQQIFCLLTQKIGIRKPDAAHGPTFHSLRHAFAIRSLQNLEPGADVSRHMLALATYLGHAKVSDTYWYLEATPELLGSIAQASEQTHRDRCGGSHD